MKSARTVHWHTEAPEGHLVCWFVEASLRALYDRANGELTVVHSWGDPDRELAVRQFPFGRAGTAASWAALTAEVQPDYQVVVRPTGETGATLSLGAGAEYPETVDAAWTWTGLPAEYPAGLPTEPCLPVLEITRPRFEHLRADEVLLILAPTTLAELTEGLEFAARLQRELPQLRVQPHWDPTAWDRLLRAGGASLSSLEVPQNPPGEAATILCCGRSLAWAPHVLQALGEGHRILVPADARYLPLLGAAPPRTWSGAFDAVALADVAAHLRDALHDRTAAADRCRRASAWARRWTPAREGARLAGLIEAAGVKAQPFTIPLPTNGTEPFAATGRTRWVVRRDVGIGDILFSLSVAAALKERDPEARVRFHTAEPHAEWVSWFPQVEEVTHGLFEPRWGERLADFEAVFPGRPDCDRTLALGAEVGIAPKRWSPAPLIPEAMRARTEERLGPSTRLRIGFAPSSRTQARHRTLPAAQSTAIAERLRLYGEVLWLDADPPTFPAPAGVRDFRGQLTTSEAWVVLDRCEVVVSADSGLLYAGVTLGKPVVGLFSHIAALERLWLAPSFLALQPHLPCSPCGEGPNSLHCLDLAPLGPPAVTTPPCLGLLTSEVVEAALVEVLRRATAGHPRRRIWSVAPGGYRTEWDVDTLPAPWRTPLIQIEGRAKGVGQGHTAG